MSNEPVPCLVFPHETAEGAANMARDEVLLELVSNGRQAGAALRTYAWTAPTLSLGYFQSIADVEAEPRWQGVPLVRRPTGGGAILHHHEVTYALAVANGHPLARGGGDLYRAVHSALAGILRELGVDAVRRGAVPPSGKARPFLCFTDKTAEDVVVGALKIIGSAQRRRAGALLQHGSILLARAPLAPELSGLLDLATLPIDATGLAELIGRRVPEALGFFSLPSAWSDGALRRAGEIEVEVYRNPAWNRRR